MAKNHATPRSELIQAMKSASWKVIPNYSMYCLSHEPTVSLGIIHLYLPLYKSLLTLKVLVVTIDALGHF